MAPKKGVVPPQFAGHQFKKKSPAAKPRQASKPIHTTKTMMPGSKGPA